LYALARTEVGRTTATDPEQIAAAVIKRLSPADIKIALKIALPLLVKRVLATTAIHHTGGNPSHEPAAVEALQQQVCVRPGTWRRLADCTAEELSSMAAFRRQVANEHQAQAAAFDRLGEAIEQAGVTTVNQLSVRVLTLVT
jgi:acid phosphatase family membrane protein YuiD